MKNILLVTLFVFSIYTQSCTFQEYIATYNRTYTGEEKDAREALFNQRIQEIEDFNSQNNGYTLKCTRWTDRFSNQMPNTNSLTNLNSELHLTSQQNQFTDIDTGVINITAGDQIDWRNQNAVSSVKNQRSCGSCWSFATVAGVESLFMLDTGIQFDLSQQYLLQCSGNNSCNGGSYNNAWRQVLDRSGLPLESQYPYRAKDNKQGICDKGTFKKIDNLAVGYENYVSKSSMNAYLNVFPLEAVIIADTRFVNYGSGVFQCSYTWTDSQINHAVQVVGYNNTGNYYIIKNSWGTDWGMNGFAYIDMDNDCALKRQTWAVTGTQRQTYVWEYHLLSIAILAIFNILI